MNAQPRAEVLQRVFSIKSGDVTGTAFAVEVDDRQYLVTAKHVVTGINDGGSIQLRRPDTLAWVDVKLRTVLRCDPADIAVLVPESVLSAGLKSLPVLLGSQGLVWGGEVYFLGFPFGFDSAARMEGGQYLFPFIKRAVVSAMVRVNDADVLYLDGYNNPGFSGGPVALFDQSQNKSRIAGVISGYRNEPRQVRMGNTPTQLVVDSNAGIIIAYSIDPAIKIIRANPVGPKLD